MPIAEKPCPVRGRPRRTQPINVMVNGQGARLRRHPGEYASECARRYGTAHSVSEVAAAIEGYGPRTSSEALEDLERRLGELNQE